MVERLFGKRREAPEVAGALRARLPVLVSGVVEEVRRRVPEYRFPPEGVLEEVRAGIEASLVLFFRILEEPPPVGEGLLSEEVRRAYVELGARRAGQGFALESVLAVPRVCLELLPVHLGELGYELDSAEPSGVVELVTELVLAATAEISRGFLEEAASTPVDVLGRLLEEPGELVVEEVRGAGLAVGSCYRVMVTSGAAAVAGPSVPPGFLAGAYSGWFVVVAPDRGDREEFASLDLPGLVCVGSARCGFEGIRAGFEEAVATFEVASGAGREGMVWAEDAALEVAVLSSPVAHLLRRPLGPLLPADKAGVLRETLRAYLAAGCSREEARRALSVSRSALGHRLGKIERLLGRSVKTQIVELGVALALEEWSPPARGGERT